MHGAVATPSPQCRREAAHQLNALLQRLVGQVGAQVSGILEQLGNVKAGHVGWPPLPGRRHVLQQKAGLRLGGHQVAVGRG